MSKFNKILNILLVDDTWGNIMCLENNIKRIEIEETEINVSTCVDG